MEEALGISFKADCIVVVKLITLKFQGAGIVHGVPGMHELNRVIVNVFLTPVLYRL